MAGTITSGNRTAQRGSKHRKHIQLAEDVGPLLRSLWRQHQQAGYNGTEDDFVNDLIRTAHQQRTSIQKETHHDPINH